MQGQIMSEQADQHTFRVRRSQETVLAREDNPRLEWLTALSVILLLSLGLWSAIRMEPWPFGGVMHKAIGVLLILAPALWLAWQMLLFHP
jgi:hypothetical protein